jgi:hypothetical protein
MKSLFAALALTPLLIATGAQAQTVSDDVNKQLWCATAFVLFFSEMKPDDVSDEDAKAYVDSANGLLEIAIKAHLDAGFTQEQIDALRVELEPRVRVEITTGPAQYAPEDCIAIMPPPEAPAPSDTSSSAM